VSPRVRVSLVVGVAALAAAGVTIGGALLTSSDEGASTSAGRPQSRAGAPPLVLDLGVRTDKEAVALRRAAAIYDAAQPSSTAKARERRRAAAAIFGRFDSIEARVGAALSRWPDGFDTVAALARSHPRSSLAQLELGLALYWHGRPQQATAAWRRAKQMEPNTAYAVRAADFLHPSYIPGLPFFVPSFPSPPQLEKLSPPKQFAFLAARARTGGVREKLLYGVALQRLSRPLSARHEFSSAAALEPSDPEARVAAAVGLFDKDRPELAFGKLGPLTRTFPKAATVRFHLGLMLLWLDRPQAAKEQFRRVVAAGPSPLRADAQAFLGKLGK
jgi:tetratricopeptide (TPR) repeat protein